MTSHNCTDKSPTLWAAVFRQVKYFFDVDHHILVDRGHSNSNLLIDLFIKCIEKHTSHIIEISFHRSFYDEIYYHCDIDICSVIHLLQTKNKNSPSWLCSMYETTTSSPINNCSPRHAAPSQIKFYCRHSWQNAIRLANTTKTDPQTH